MTEICEHRISWKDMQDTLKDEIGIEFVFNNIKFNPVDSKRVLDIIERYRQGYCSANECVEQIEREVKNKTEPKAKNNIEPKISAEVVAKELSRLIAPKIKEQIERELGE